MNKEDLKKRLKELAVSNAKLCIEVKANTINKVYIGQIVRSSSSSAANYRAACRENQKLIL